MLNLALIAYVNYAMNVHAFSEEETMRLVLFTLFLSACHVGYLSGEDTTGTTVAEKAHGLTCELTNPSYTHADITQAAVDYLKEDVSTGVILIFYKDADDDLEDISLIEVSCTNFHFSKSDDGQTGFLMSFSETHVSSSLSDFFLEDGAQALINEEEIWLSLFALEDGDLNVYRLLVSEAGNEENTGSCKLLL